MKVRTSWLMATMAMLCAGSSTRAQGRFEVTPFVGYESAASVVLNGEAGPVGQDALSQLRVNGSVAYGGFVDFSLTQHIQPEFMWNRNNTSYSALDTVTGTYGNAYTTNINQFQFGGIYVFRESDAKLRPYVGGSLGFTEETNGGGTPSRSGFSYSVGGGAKYFVTKYIGFRGDFRYLPAHASSTDQLFCAPVGCYAATVGSYLKRTSVTGGVMLRF